MKIVPDIQVGSDAGGVIGGLGALLMRTLADGHDGAHDTGPDAGAAEAAPPAAATAEPAAGELAAGS